MTPRVSVVLVNYNAGAELAVALRSIAAEVPGTDWEGIVVDNASSDGSDDIVAEFAPSAKLLRNDRNLGFAKAVNQGIAQTTAPLVLIMNPDCRLAPGAMTSLEAELAAYPECAIVGPRTLNPDGSIQGSARGDPDMLTGLFGRSTFLRRMFPDLSIAKRNVVTADALPAGVTSLVVDWVSGACMLARRGAMQKVGGFDERYFLYWEDADLCKRLRAVGYHVRYVPGATAIHRVGHSSQKVRASAIRAFHASAYLYYATHVAPRPLQPARLLARLLLSVRCWLSLRQA